MIIEPHKGVGVEGRCVEYKTLPYLLCTSEQSCGATKAMMGFREMTEIEDETRTYYTMRRKANKMGTPPLCCREVRSADVACLVGGLKDKNQL